MLSYSSKCRFQKKSYCTRANIEKIKGQTPACDAHFEVGNAIRNTIKQVGGTLPEEMPVPDKSLKELVKKDENKKFIDIIK